MRCIGFRIDRKQAAIADMHIAETSRSLPRQAALIAGARKEKPACPRSEPLNPVPVNISTAAAAVAPAVTTIERVAAWFREWGAQGPAIDQLERNVRNVLDKGYVWLPVRELTASRAFTADFVVPNGRSFLGNGIVCHNTPMHSADLLGTLAKTAGYATHTFPAISASGKPLWPERFPIEELDKIRSQVGAIRFAREFICEAVSNLSSLFPIQLFKGDPVEQYAVTLGHDWRWWKARGIVDIFIGVDFAFSSAIGSDFTVIFVLGVDQYGNRWVVDIVRDRGLQFGEQKSRIVEVSRRFKPALIFVESNQAQKIFGDELIRQTDLPIKYFQTTGDKHSLEHGIPSLALLLENRKLRIPRGDDARTTELTDIFIDEMRAFTYSNGRVLSLSEHDDCAMAYYIAEQAVSGGNFSFAFNAQPEDITAYEELVSETMRDDDDEWGDYIPGAIPRVGRPKMYNAMIVDSSTVDEAEDNPRNPHGMPKPAGTRPSVLASEEQREQEARGEYSLLEIARRFGGW
jgi:hypothetical protein